MTITLCNGKGGSGKTTLSILLASALAEAGHSVAVKDCDPQATATRWINEVQKLRVAAVGETYDALIIDTPPRLDSRELHESLAASDIVILVTSPSPADLWTSRDTVAAVSAHIREATKTRVLFNQVQSKTVLARELADMAGRIGLRPLNSVIHRRQVYQHSALLGWKALNPEAREEILKVALEIAALSSM
ncbi:MAG: chromosome partitioning protein [Acidobacteriaceae bacterium]|jgi:chromosome partitioning protein|nr:chromosome partitioning protein [Acidobacteriaceae bacterium]